MELKIRLDRQNSGPLKGDPLYLKVEWCIEDLLLQGRYKAGDRIPPEAELVDILGVRRVTKKKGLGRLVERGLLERRRGSGTFLVRPPKGARLQAGLERLETYTVHAERMGLKLDSEDLDVAYVGARPEEAEALEVPEGSPLVKVSRVLLVEGKPAAWMVDVVPESVLGAEEIPGTLPPGRYAARPPGLRGRRRGLLPDVHRGRDARAGRPGRRKAASE